MSRDLEPVAAHAPPTESSAPQDRPPPRNVQQAHQGSGDVPQTGPPCPSERDLPKSSELVSYPHPYSNKNRKIFYVDDVTTKYEEILKDRNIIQRMKNYVSQICINFPNNTMVFFPSFNYLRKFKKDFQYNTHIRLRKSNDGNNMKKLI